MQHSASTLGMQTSQQSDSSLLSNVSTQVVFRVACLFFFVDELLFFFVDIIFSSIFCEEIEKDSRSGVIPVHVTMVRIVHGAITNALPANNGPVKIMNSNVQSSNKHILIVFTVANFINGR